jgi:cytoskeletal protein RodZ
MNDTSTPDPNREGSAGPFATLGQKSTLPAEPPPQASDVGTLLCATRMRLGKDLQNIATVLHIRYNFLVAIEDGRYEDLPGQAYAIGFVRAYADHLGLDGDEVVRRYKEETAGIKRAVRYEYPIPAPESGIPSGALLMIAVVMGMVVYGVWYSMADADKRAADVIQEVPDRLAALLKSDAEPMPEPSAAQTAAVQEETDFIPPAMEDDDGPTVQTPSAPQVQEPAPQTAPTPAPVNIAEAPKPAPVPAPVTEKPADKTVPVPVVVAPIPAPVVTAAAPTIVAPAPASAPAASKPTPPTTVAVTPPPAAAPKPATPTPQVATAPNAAPRPAAPAQQSAPSARGAVELRAKSDSWIQVRDGEQLLLTRFLRKGETYKVPERNGLTLMTLNAGGIEIMVDGQTMPPLGEAGTVARGVALDPAKLKAAPKPAPAAPATASPAN